MQHLKRAWLFALLFKLLISAFLPLSSDEAYYWVWSQNLQLSYFDHPSMVAWLFYIGDFFREFHHAVRWPAVILGHVTMWIWILILKDHLEIKKIQWWFYVALFSPLIGFGSIIVTPDLPVVFFWSLATYFFLKWEASPNFKNSACLGAALGLGFCSKYHIVLWVFSFFVYLIFEKKWSYLKQKTIVLIILFGLIFSSPVLIWNFLNDFSSFKFQINHGLGAESWDPFWSYSYLIGQILLIFPTVVFLAFKNGKPQSQKIIWYLAWVPLAFFFISSFKGKVEMNWPLVAYPAVFAMAVSAAKKSKGLWVANSFWILLVVIVTLNIPLRFIKDPPAKLNEPFYYAPIENIGQKYKPLYAGTYQIASYLWYQTKKPIYKLRNMSRRDFYDELSGSLPQDKVFYVVGEVDCEFPSWVDKHFKVTLEEKIHDQFVIYKIVQLN